MKVTDKYSRRREKTENIRGDVKETVETLKKQTNIGGDVKETDKYGGDDKETDKYWWRRQRNR